MKVLEVSEYTVIEDLSIGVFKALRNGEEWRDLVGDNFILSLLDKIEDLEDELTQERKVFDLLEKSVDQSDDSYKIFERFHKLREKSE